MNKNALRAFGCAIAFTVALTGAAFAQLPMPSINLAKEKHSTPEQIEHDKAIDQAYQSATKKIPDQSHSTIPGPTVRPAPPAPLEKKKQQLSQNKKHAAIEPSSASGFRFAE